MSIYIVYDKINGNEIINKEDGQYQDKVNHQEDVENDAFFDKYLYTFLPEGSAGYFKRTMTDFTDEDITMFLYWYVMVNCGEKDMNSCTVSKHELDAIVEKYFDKRATYTITASSERSGIRKLSDDLYEVFWFPTGWQSPTHTRETVERNDNNIVVTYKLTETLATAVEETESRMVFNLLYLDGRYVVKGIDYIG